jgi:DUF4097 and DUF4098 domain-containing protein YvlB
MKKIIWLPIVAVIIAGLYGTMYLQHAPSTTVTRATFAQTKDIQLSAKNADIEVQNTAGTRISVEETANVKYTPRKISATAHAIKIAQGQTHLRAIDHLFATNIRITVRIPKTYQGHVTITSRSGVIHLRNVPARTVNLRTDSGSINGTITTKQLTARATSGAVNLHTAGLSQNSRVDAASGAVSLELRTTKLKRITARSDSGAIKLTNWPHIQHEQHYASAGAKHGPLLKVTTTSGSIHIH